MKHETSMQAKIKLCIFVHFSASKTIPYYVQMYAKELSKYFDEVRFLTNNKDNAGETDFFKDNIIPVFDKNEGYDFGRIYNYLRKINLDDYEQIACINDSNILLGSLDKTMEWGLTSQLDFWGIVDSHEKPWFSKHENNYHIQSHFIVFNTKAIKYLQKYFQSIDLDSILREKNKKELRRRVINDWEIGLSQYFLKNEVSIGAYKKSIDFIQNKGSGKPVNVTHKYYYELVKDGYPLLKKKIITDGKWYDWMLKKKHWKNLILNYAHPNLKQDVIISELLDAKRKFKQNAR